MLLISDKWEDYKIIDSGYGEKLEKWGKFTFIRPDPQILWPSLEKKSLWKNVYGKYIRSSSGGGRWEFYKKLPERWQINYGELKFYIRPTGFKHMGLFPEQAVNWEWMQKIIKKQTFRVKILNLFAYTGGATIACAKAGAEVCHVDSAKGMVRWAKENIELNGLKEAPVRYIIDDVMKFVKREIRRKKKYDAIIMDPPSYGRGKSGETWKIEKHLLELIKDCMEILSERAIFFLINSYTAGYSPIVMKNLLSSTIGKNYPGKITAGEVAIPIGNRKDFALPCGIFARWSQE